MNNTKKGLGKGLSALLSDVNTDITGKNAIPLNTVSEIPLNEIETNPFQPRERFDDESLDALVESIKIHGIIQPVTVRKMGYGKYQLIAGERRVRASFRAELKTVPAFVRVADDKAMLEMSLIENIHRDDLNPIEIGISYKRLMEECNLKQEEVAHRIGVNRSTVTNFLRILKLPDEIQLAIRDKILSMGHAKMIVGVEDTTQQLKIYKTIIDDNLTVRDVEEIVKKIKAGGDISKPAASQKNNKVNDLAFKEWEEKFSDIYQTKVKIKTKNNGKGSIVIPFNDNEDIERIASLFENRS